MHDGGTIDVFAPFGAFSGASRNKNHLIGTMDNSNSSNNNGDTINNGGDCSVEPQQLDNAELNGGTNNNNIADNVDGFLDEFLAFVDSGGGGESMDDFMDTDASDKINGNGSSSGDIAEEELDWLEDMDLSAFLPPTAAPDDALAGAANTPLPSPAHEIDPLPEPAVVEDGPAAAAAAASVAPAFAGGGGGAGRNGHTDGGAVANNGGGGGGGGGVVDAPVVSRKEQLRRQKVARYLAKKKKRQWSKAKASSYQSRQRVANSRPRHKGRFLPLESDFVSVAELQRRQRALMKQMQEKAAALSFGPIGRGGASPLITATTTPVAAAAASGNVPPLSPEFGNQVAI